MGQIPRSTERISGFIVSFKYLVTEMYEDSVYTVLLLQM